MSAQLESDPESTQQRSAEVFLLLKRETAWQGPGLGHPEPHVADKKTSFWNWPKCFVVVMLEEVWTLTPSLWVSSSMRWKDGIQESQRPRWWRWEEDSWGGGPVLLHHSSHRSKRRHCHCSHSLGQGAEALRGDSTCPKSHNPESQVWLSREHLHFALYSAILPAPPGYFESC